MIRQMLGLFAVVLLCRPTLAAVQRPPGPVKNCTEGECHAKERSYKFLHGPTALGACDVCHQADDEKKHTFTLKQKDKALCDFCHVEKQAVAAKVMHKPVADGQCLACHNPHGSNVKKMLKRDDMSALCKDCHGDVTKQRTHVHGPVASGSCVACHNAHGGEYPKLLAAKGRDLCLGCHEQMKTQLASVKYMHKPLEGECQQCHEVHASNQIMQLKQPPFELCTSCHAPIKDLAMNAKFKHDPVTQGQACITCHTPHGSDMAKLVKNTLPQTCLSCHNKPIKTEARTVAAVPEINDKHLSQHGPIREGNCSGCHTPHGGEFSRLLAKTYPETFYESFDLEKYALCFTCHEKQLVLLEKTTGLTNFRNGEQNLHFVHVNKSDRGRSCRACHATHASDKPVHVRDSVPYGKWDLPINFNKVATGGSCAPGCHSQYGYDREKPVTNIKPGTTAPATPTAATGGASVPVGTTK